MTRWSPTKQAPLAKTNKLATRAAIVVPGNSKIAVSTIHVDSQQPLRRFVP